MAPAAVPRPAPPPQARRAVAAAKEAFDLDPNTEAALFATGAVLEAREALCWTERDRGSLASHGVRAGGRVALVLVALDPYAEPGPA